MHGPVSRWLFIQEVFVICLKTFIAEGSPVQSTAEISNIQEILEKSKDIKDSSQYTIGSRIVQEDPVLHHNAYKATLRTFKMMFTLSHKLSGSMNKSSKAVSGSRPLLHVKASSFCPHVPNITGTGTPLKEGELRCYECWQKGHIKPQCPKLKGKQRVARMYFKEVVDEDNQTDVLLMVVSNDTPEEVDVDTLEKIWTNIRCRWGQSTQVQLGWSRISNEFNINEDNIIDTQMRIAAGTIYNMVKPIYDHRTRMKDCVRPLQKHDDYRAIFVFWEIKGVKAHCLIDSGCKGVMTSPEFTRAAKIKTFTLKKPIWIQLAVTGSKSIINYGTNTTINVDGKESKEYFNVVNIDYYDSILGTIFLKKYNVIIDFIQDCLKIKDKIICNQAGDFKMSGNNPWLHTSAKALKPEKPPGSPKDSHWLSSGLSTTNGGIDGGCVLKIQNTKTTSHLSHKSLGLKKPMSIHSKIFLNFMRKSLNYSVIYWDHSHLNCCHFMKSFTKYLWLMNQSNLSIDCLSA